MATVTSFGYTHGASFLHLYDIRLKLISLLFLNIVVLNLDMPTLFIASIFMTYAILKVGIPVLKSLYEIRYFGVLLLFILLTRSLFSEAATASSVHFSPGGFKIGAEICWRLLLVVSLGQLFIFTSTSSDIKKAIEFFFRPIPFLPEKRIAVMLGLMIKFIPIIMNNSREISDAQKLRGGGNCKTPIKRLVYFSLALLRKLFTNADGLINAMEVRGYNEEPSLFDFNVTLKDWLLLIGIILLGGLLFSGSFLAHIAIDLELPFFLNYFPKT